MSLGAPLASLLAQRVASEPPPELVIPVPLSASRLRARGFNQAAELARRVAAALGLPVAMDLGVRVRETLPQADLPWDERAANMRGAFACRSVPARARIAVVDDVMTTSATLEELARTLRRSGASEVVAWVVARAERP
jgi:predicted amidophosphoribosyltransferase